MGATLALLAMSDFDGGSTSPSALLLRGRLPGWTIPGPYLARPHLSPSAPMETMGEFGRAYRWIGRPRPTADVGSCEDDACGIEPAPMDWPEDAVWDPERPRPIPARFLEPPSGDLDLVPWPDELTK
jgi:hypothetical protein